MLTDTALRNLKPKSRVYKATDRDGMYVTVSPVGTVTFRFDYRLHGRRETLTLGRYGQGGISLSMARELLLDARKSLLKGISPALEKQREKRRVIAIKTFDTAMDAWFVNAKLADSTRAMRKHIIDRDILPVFRNRLLGFDELQQAREAMQATNLDEGEASVFARVALALKYDDPLKPAPVTESQILMPRRFDDRRLDLWSVFNRTQENLTQGGLRARSANGRRLQTRAVQGIDQNIRLNRALWLLADGMRQLKG
ncbi:integrase arm-type DNA-binding domain-containing protein [Herbaspirillum sp. alder98]|uniref:integrase arm-type DNA-binding domain-containing protein n=1 Tax=Herbaspirillum sp. alder98 TaxID=2913096 RepID=UPI002A5A0921|nr:integrase arm-type DNA-binding domain-containing protein [Herbaspirillum sp. alder98]